MPGVLGGAPAARGVAPLADRGRPTCRPAGRRSTRRSCRRPRSAPMPGAPRPSEETSTGCSKSAARRPGREGARPVEPGDQRGRRGSPRATAAPGPAWPAGPPAGPSRHHRGGAHRGPDQEAAAAALAPEDDRAADPVDGHPQVLDRAARDGHPGRGPGAGAARAGPPRPAIARATHTTTASPRAFEGRPWAPGRRGPTGRAGALHAARAEARVTSCTRAAPAGEPAGVRTQAASERPAAPAATSGAE